MFVGDRVMVMLGEHHPSRGTVVEVADRFRVCVQLDVLWPPGAEQVKVWFDEIDLLKLEKK